MSMDWMVYLKKGTACSSADLQRFFTERSMAIFPDPTVNLDHDFGFFPMVFDGQILSEELAGQKLLSGFEIFPDAYDYDSELQEVVSSQPKKRTLFRPKQMDTPVYLVDEAMDKLLQQCDRVITMTMHEPLELLFTLLLGDFICRQGGLLLDCQEGAYFTDAADPLSQVYEELHMMLEEQALVLHPYVGP